jgi:apolipoprotein D and lipocalin family protein
MRKSLSAVFVPILLMIGVCFLNPPQTIAQQGAVTAVPFVDLKRYSGKWFEIAKLPTKFQKQCVGNTSATFNTMVENNRLQVLNSCLQKNGKVDQLRGEAKVIDARNNAKMKVSFPKFSSDSYWIVDLDQNYQYAVIANPNREYLWILSRTPQMNDAIYQQILRRIETMGFKPNKLVKTPQNVEMLKGTIVEKQGN